jgi:serine/threonine-protein kinase
MLTGRRVFPGGDVTETIAAIVKSEPEWSLLSGSAPAGIQRLLRRCLQKDANRRLHHMADARLDLEDALGADPVTAALVSPAPTRSGWVTALPWATAVLALVIAASAVFWTGRGGSGQVPPVTRLELNLPEGVELFNSARTIAISPDGRRLVFIGVLNGSRRLYLRRLDQIEAEPLRGTDGATTCFFSQDGASIGFVTTTGQLMTISLADGLVARVTGDASFLYGGAWMPDGSIVFPRGGTFWLVAGAGGAPRQVTTLDAARVDSRHAWPTILPDSQTMLFGVQSGDRWRIDSTNLATGTRQTVVENGTLPLYVSSGVLVFFRDGRLIAAPFDPVAVKVTGPTVQLLDDLPALAPGIPLLDVSLSGTVVYSPSTAVSRLVWTKRSGEEQLLNDEPRIYANPRLSPDGQRIAVQAGDLWMQDLARTTFTRLTSGEILSNGFAIWTPDGRRVIYRSSTGLRIQEVSGSGGDVQVIAGTNEFDYPAAISPDGDTLVFLRVASTNDTSLDILSLSLKDPTRIQSLVATPAYEGGARLSADGRWMAYVSNESGRNEIYLRPFPGPGERWQVSIEGGTQVVWNPDGRELFYRQDERMMAVDVTTTPSVTLSPPRQLFETRYVYGAGITIANYDIARDGQRFVMVKAESMVSRLNVVLNWFTDLAAAERAR